MAFEVIPAIDLRGGKCVRLFQGDFNQETFFSDDPVSVARGFEAAGAVRIHVVDLDGAEAGHPVNAALIRSIVETVSIPVQVGGGLRTAEAIDGLIETGAQRVVLGTAAIENEGLVSEAARRHGDRVAVGIDARQGWVATHAWKSASRTRAIDLVGRLESLGVSRFVYTDILRDGAMSGPNIDALAELTSKSNASVIASGGVASLDHLLDLMAMAVEGAIVGRAVYTGDIDLKQAIGVLGARDGR